MDKTLIVGNGMLANAFYEFEKQDDILVFASGVSNSKEISPDAFSREEALLKDSMKKYHSKTIVYFSTCSVYDTYFPRSEYTRHKMNMETMIVESGIKYHICRLPQVLGNNNQYQLTGFLHRAIQANERFNLFDIERNIIDIQDVVSITKAIISNSSYLNQVINIANPKNIKVVDLVSYFEEILKKKASYDIKRLDGSLTIDVSDIEHIFENTELLDGNYVKTKLGKYFEKFN